MTSERFDVAVVGGGPAGATLALRLGRAGVRTLLIEKKRFPRFKPCGEFMSPQCLPILDDLGVLERVLALGGARVTGMRLHGWSHRASGRFAPVGRARPPAPWGLAVRRERFDAVLLDAAAAAPNVEVRERTEFVGLLRDARGRVDGLRARGSRGETSVAARVVVGADGLRSRVARELGVQQPIRWLDKLALTTRFAGVPAQASAQVHFFAGGYFAATSVDAGLFSLNLVLDRERVERRASGWDGFLREHLRLAPALECLLADAERVDPVRGCGPLATRTAAQVFDGAALVGDACGYVDPVTGEGIFFALRGAQMLAPELLGALARGHVRARALRGYARARRHEIGSRSSLATLLQRGLRHPALTRGFLAALSARPGLADLLVAVTGDYVPGREVLRPAVWWNALRRSAGAASLPPSLDEAAAVSAFPAWQRGRT